MKLLLVLISVFYNFNIGSLIFISNSGKDQSDCGKIRKNPCATIQYAIHFYSNLIENDNKELELFLLEGFYEESIFFVCIPKLTVESIIINGEDTNNSILFGNLYLESCNFTVNNIRIKSDTMGKIYHVITNSENINFEAVTYDSVNMSVKFIESHVSMHNMILKNCFYSNPDFQLLYIKSQYKEISVNLDGLIIENSYPFYLGIYANKGNISLRNINEEKAYFKKDVLANGNTRMKIKAGDKFPVDVNIEKININLAGSFNEILRLSGCRGRIKDSKFSINEKITAKSLISLENSIILVEGVVVEVFPNPSMVNLAVIQIDGESSIDFKNISLPNLSYMCPQGHYLMNRICYPCHKGYYRKESNNESACLPCNYGFYSPNFGQAECIPCSPGTYCNILGCMTCRKCESDYVSSTAGSSKCLIFHPFLITSIVLSLLLMIIPMIILIVKYLKTTLERRLPIFTLLGND